MSGGGVVPESLGLEVSEQQRIIGTAHPVVGIGPHHAVLGVFVRFARRLRRGGHEGHRRPVRPVAALIAALTLGVGLATVGAASSPPAGAADGEPLTAGDIAYTYNRVLDGGPEAGNWGTYLTSVEKITAPDDTTVVLELSKPNAVLPLLPIPILPEHIWSDVAEDEVKSYRNEP